MKQILFLSLILFCYRINAQNLDINLLKSINPNEYNTQVKYQQFISNNTTLVDFSVPAILLASSFIRNDKNLRDKSITIFETLIMAGGSSFVLKNVIKRERPFLAYPNDIYNYGKGGSYSFPSGHTTEAFALATSLSINFKQWYVVVPAYLWAGSVGYSRMYLGVHYPSDVLAGAVLGSASAFFSFKLNKWINKRTK